MHRDLKPSNILVDHEGNIKISDFGLPIDLSDKALCIATGKVGTRGYMAPEVLLGMQYSFDADVWVRFIYLLANLFLFFRDLVHNFFFIFQSLGCILAEMGRGKRLYKSSKDPSKQISNIFEIFGTPTIHSWPENDWSKFANKPATNWEQKFHPDIVPLLKKLFELNPENRITCHSALKKLL